MSDVIQQLQERVKRLEEEMRQVKSNGSSQSEQGWPAIVGTFAGDATFDQMVREMRKNRRKDYRDAIARFEKPTKKRGAAAKKRG